MTDQVQPDRATEIVSPAAVAEEEYDEEGSTGNCIANTFAGIGECMANFCFSTFDRLADWISDGWDCLVDRCTGCVNGCKYGAHPSNVGSTARVDEYKDMAVLPRLTSPPQHQSQANVALSNQMPLHPPKQLPQVSALSVSSTTSKVSGQSVSSALPPRPDVPAPGLTREKSPDLPPKLGFNAVGSIFGDRKRTNVDKSMLLLENGRFRSPGISKVTQGPGGRSIRVSFVTGFPKSIESHNSLQTSMSRVSKKSLDSLPPHPLQYPSQQQVSPPTQVTYGQPAHNTQEPYGPERRQASSQAAKSPKSPQPTPVNLDRRSVDAAMRKTSNLDKRSVDSFSKKLGPVKSTKSHKSAKSYNSKEDIQDSLNDE